jgi:glutamate-1-semialdehyde aminotransferase
MKSNSQKIWDKAKRLIPTGNHLLSKHPDLFLPNQWPEYYKKAKGIYIWDLKNKKYIDLCLMGVGTNVLGYANRNIDNEVIKSIKKSNMSSLNNINEYYLARDLLKLHPWFHMAKFARTGAEANAIALRISRAHSGKENVAVCGYHGWHDWYLAANYKKKSLDSHLFPNLKSKGVIKSLKNNIFSFDYNNFDQLKKLINTKNIGTIFMEVSRTYKPKNNFLQKIRKISQQKKIVLIFDECSSGFRECNGGLHKKLGIYPDLAMFGKALGNGYAITSILGNKKIMKAAEKTFISSTFWTEGIGFVAGRATLKEFNRLKPWKKIKKMGIYIKKRWLDIAKKNNIEIEVFGLDALPGFKFKYKENNLYKSFITQEFLKNNILASTSIYVSNEHNMKVINKYLVILDKIFAKISEHRKDKKKKKLLNGPEAMIGMSRSN